MDTLAAAGADLEASDDSGLRPLHAAAQRGNAGAAEALVRLGANATVPTCQEWHKEGFLGLSSLGILHALELYHCLRSAYSPPAWMQLLRLLPAVPGRPEKPDRSHPGPGPPGRVGPLRHVPGEAGASPQVGRKAGKNKLRWEKKEFHSSPVISPGQRRTGLNGAGV